jgi:hypothetical protein
MKITELSKFWNIPYSTLSSRKKKEPREFEAFELGSICIKEGLSKKDLTWLIEVKKERK